MPVLCAGGHRTTQEEDSEAPPPGKGYDGNKGLGRLPPAVQNLPSKMIRTRNCLQHCLTF